MTNIVDLYARRARRFVAGQNDLLDTVADTARRNLLVKSATLGLSAVGAAGAIMAPSNAQAQTIGDADVLNFALNLEYLEAEYYLRAVTGQGLPDDMITGSGTPGAVTGGRQVTFETTVGRQYAKEIAADEKAHVAFLRSALGAAGRVARPAINIQESFTALFRAAGIIGANENFDPYLNENNFLLGAFVFEDVGVTAYKGASPLLANKDYLEAAAGILAVEAYHAGLIRTVLYGKGIDTPSLRTNADKLAAARNSVDGPNNDDQGISPGQDPSFTDADASNIVPLDENGIAFSRSAFKVLNVVYLTPNAASSGGFFPAGVNGTIKMSTASTSAT